MPATFNAARVDAGAPVYGSGRVQMASEYVEGQVIRPVERPDQACYRLNMLRGCAIVTAWGEIDIATSPGLDEALQKAGHRSMWLIVDVSEVTFLDSAGLHSLIRAQNRAREDGGRLCLVGVPEIIRRVLQLTQLESLLPSHRSLDEALDQMMGSAGPE